MTGMSTLKTEFPEAISVRMEAHKFFVVLEDGRENRCALPLVPPFGGSHTRPAGGVAAHRQRYGHPLGSSGWGFVGWGAGEAGDG